MNKNEYHDWIPIFRLKPKSEYSAKCQHFSYCKNEDQLVDETILSANLDLNHPRYTIKTEYRICNITGDFLLKNDKLPVAYLTVLYSGKFVNGCLFNIPLVFNIDEDMKKKLDDPKKYVGALMNGFYTLELAAQQETDFLNKIKPFIEDSVFLKHMNNFMSMEKSDEMRKLIAEIKIEIENIMKNYQTFFDVIRLEKYPSQKYVLEKLSSIINDKLFGELIMYGLMLREKERADDRGQTYDAPPKQTFDIKKLRNNPNEIDKIFDERKNNV